MLIFSLSNFFVLPMEELQPENNKSAEDCLAINEILIPEIWSMIADYLPDDDPFLRKVLLRRIQLSNLTQERIMHSFINKVIIKSVPDNKKILYFIKNHKKHFDKVIKQKFKNKIKDLLIAYIEENGDLLKECLNVEDAPFAIIKDKFQNCLNREISNIRWIKHLVYFLGGTGLLIGSTFVVCLLKQQIGDPCYGVIITLDVRHYAGAVITGLLGCIFLKLRSKKHRIRSIQKLTK